MSSVSITDPAFMAMLRKCRGTLERMAAYELPQPLEQRMRALGESKEFLSEPERDELLALVDFARQRTLEKLEARSALEKLRAIVPDAREKP